MKLLCNEMSFAKEQCLAAIIMMQENMMTNKEDAENTNKLHVLGLSFVLLSDIIAKEDKLKSLLYLSLAKKIETKLNTNSENYVILVDAKKEEELKSYIKGKQAEEILINKYENNGKRIVSKELKSI